MKPCSTCHEQKEHDAFYRNNPKEADNMPEVSRPNHCPGGGPLSDNMHSWDSYGDEWRCSFCPAVFRAPPPSDTAPPKVRWKDVVKTDEIITIDENGEVRLPAPPTDTAQPVDSWKWRQYLRPRTVPPFWGPWHWQESKPDLGPSVEIQPLYAHPEDALPRTPDFHPDDRSTDPEEAPEGPTQRALLKAAQKNLHTYGENDDTERGEAAWALAARIDVWILALDRLQGDEHG